MSNDQDHRSELARDRTELAEDRTVLAHERSFAGWVRTGMAAVGIGLGFHALFGALQPTWVPKVLASVFLLIAAFIFRSAEQRACRVLNHLEPHKVTALKPIRMRLLSWSLIVATGALGLSVWLLV